MKLEICSDMPYVLKSLLVIGVFFVFGLLLLFPLLIFWFLKEMFLVQYLQSKILKRGRLNIDQQKSYWIDL